MAEHIIGSDLPTLHDLHFSHDLSQ